MLNWTAHDAFVLDGATFRIVADDGRGFGFEGLGDWEFVLYKPRSMVEEYVELLADLRPRNIFELGIYKGGSTAFLAQLARPETLVAVDIERNSSDLFSKWLTSGAAANVSVHYGVDQSDAEALREIVASEFHGQPLDLIVDDASHLFGPSRISLNALFPHLRTGGLYVIEDWDAQHVLEKNPLPNPVARERIDRSMGVGVEPPLTLLLFEALLALAYTGVVDDIRIRRSWVSFRRGAEPITPGQFEISECYMQRGRDLLNLP